MKYLNNHTLALLLTLTIATSGNMNANNANKEIAVNEYQLLKTAKTQSYYGSSLRTDCTLTFKNEDGTNLEVTFHDISVYQCAKMKIGKWIKETF